MANHPSWLDYHGAVFRVKVLGMQMWSRVHVSSSHIKSRQVWQSLVISKVISKERCYLGQADYMEKVELANSDKRP